jgi:hypothetical protein
VRDVRREIALVAAPHEQVPAADPAQDFGRRWKQADDSHRIRGYVAVMRSLHVLPTAALALVAATVSHADIIYATQGPFGGFLGLWGPVVSQQQSVGARFIPSANHTLTHVRIWFMNDSDVPGAPLRITLRGDASATGAPSIPSDQVIAEWHVTCAAAGWNPVQHTVVPTAPVALRAGVRYWVVAQSPAPGGASPVWCFASVGNAFSAVTTGDGITWQPGGSGAAPTLVVEGTPGLPASSPDINGDGTVNGLDLTALLAAWGTSSASCDLNGDGTVSGIDLTALLAAWN